MHCTHSRHLHTWFSAYETDKVFGAKYDFFKQSLEGKNTYINPPFSTYMNDEHVITHTIRKVANELRSDRPTRVSYWFRFSKDLLEIYTRRKLGKRNFWKLWVLTKILFPSLRLNTFASERIFDQVILQVKLYCSSQSIGHLWRLTLSTGKTCQQI